jgi:hypothetical protein
MQYLLSRAAPQTMREPTGVDLLDPRIQRRIEEVIK